LKGAIDLRHAALGPRGYKLKPIKSGTSSLLKVQHAAAQLQQQADEPQGMDTDAAEPYAAPAVKRQRAEGVAYRNVSAHPVVCCSNAFCPYPFPSVVLAWQYISA